MKDIKVKETIGIYPGKKNGYMVDITFDDGTVREHMMYKVEVEKFLYLKEMKDKLSEEDYLELEKMFKTFGDHMYDRAMDESAMRDAGADL